MYEVDHRLPREAGYCMPAEWEAHRGCLIAYPCRRSAYGSGLAAARRAVLAVARAVAEFEPVSLLVRPQDEAAAKKAMGGGAAGVEVLALPMDDAWLRDSAPTYVVHRRTGEVAGVDWIFNAWGRKYAPWDKDDALAAALLRRQNLRRFLAPLVLEGGSIHVNGAGAVLTSEQCLLHKNRNPRLSKAEIARLLCDYLGAEEVLWLAGDARDRETDGHIDNIACFADERHLLLMRGSTADLRENLRRAQSWRGYEITLLPRPQVREAGEDLLASYVNFYIANGGIVMPAFGVKEDALARQIIAEAFPGRKVVQVMATDIVRGGGGIHCITQQVAE